MTRTQKQQYLIDAIEAHERREFNTDHAITVSDTSEVPRGFYGEVLHINDHGNVTLYRAFKNGSLREIASCV